MKNLIKTSEGRPFVWSVLLILVQAVFAQSVSGQILVDAPSGYSYYGMHSPDHIAASFTLTNNEYVATIDVVLWTPSTSSFTFDFSLQDSLTSPFTTFASANLTTPKSSVSTQTIIVNKTLPAGTYYLTGIVPDYYGTPVTPGNVNGWMQSNGIYNNAKGAVANGLWSQLDASTWHFASGDNDGYYAPAFTVRGKSGSTDVPSIKWTFQIGDYGSDIQSSPAIGRDGTVYIGSHNGKLYAINSNGTLKWAFATKTTGDLSCGVCSSPAIGEDGTIYVGSEDTNLYAINANGTEKWSFKTEDIIFSSPALAADGTVYVGSNDDYLYAIRPNGSLKWKLNLAGSWSRGVKSSPAVSCDGTIYVGTGKGSQKLFAINANGSIKWSFDAGHYVDSSPAIDRDGTIYVGTTAQVSPRFFAINPDGTKKWDIAVGDENQTAGWGSPTVAPDGTIYVQSLFPQSSIFAVNPNGTRKWCGTGVVPDQGSVAIGADGVIYLGSSALNGDGSVRWNLPDIIWVSSSPAIGNDGTVYVASSTGNLYAIKTNSGGLAHSGWPMFHHDLNHTGRAILAIDSDNDGLLDSLESATCSNPLDADTDDDGIPDGEEDTNLNGHMDAGETDPCTRDTDKDGIQDGTELGKTAGVIDPDGDGPLLGTNMAIFIPDSDPTTTTNPHNADTDGDGILDGVEDPNHNGRVDKGEKDPNRPNKVMSWLPLLLQD